MIKVGTDRGIDANINRWLNDLRVPERGYRQWIGGELISPDGEGEVRYCCLGVALDALYEDVDDYGSEFFMVKSDRDHFGLTEDDQIELATLNDKGRPFSVIADVIETAWRCGWSIDRATTALRVW